MAEQRGLFSQSESGQTVWLDMPSHSSTVETLFRTVHVHLATEDDYRDFVRRMGADGLRKSGGMNSYSFHLPPREPVGWQSKAWASSHSDFTRPQYPVYIISKGRYRNQQTARQLACRGVDFTVVVEPQEESLYRETLPAGRILVLPFSDLGQGSIPARNFVWNHATAAGARRHWILDDNIKEFRRHTAGTIYPTGDGLCFRAVEEMADRYTNVPMAGLNYQNFVARNGGSPPVTMNTRIYSMILLSNKPKDRLMWRGRYNEDTDLSLRFLKRGDCTILCNHFTGDKVTTMTMSGGNADIYSETDNRQEFAESLRRQHPDVVSVIKKWGRWHHLVNYRPFMRNKPVAVPGRARVIIPEPVLIPWRLAGGDS